MVTWCLQERKEAREVEQCEVEQQAAVSGLSEREKRAMAAEKRMVARPPSSAALLTR